MIGKIISHYKIIEKLGDGGMGEVYLAEDIKLKRKVALKFLPQEFSRDPESKKRFINEARYASSLDHNNICIIHEINETENGQLFISMNFCRGDSLQNYIKGKDLTLKDILKIVKQIAKGLEKAHSKGIVHCDIKPNNIIITDDGIAKIVDFGIAKIASQEKLHNKERTSGTIAYMSPEQVSNSEIDARTDIWSLGVVFYEMLTKQAPFQDSYNEALMYSIINEDPIAITNINPDIPVQLDQIAIKMLEKNPDDRYRSVTELLKDIKKFTRQKDLPAFPLKILNYVFNTEKKVRYYILSLIISIVAIVTIALLTITNTPYVPSIGIMNMVNLGDPEDEFWSRGITEDLIINVASAGVIRVPTIDDVNKYKLSDFSMAEVANKLRVDYLLISSFFKADSVFDLWCRIIDPKSGKDVFAKKWSKPVNNISTITTILAGTVLNNLGISSAKTNQPIIINPDAYELYLKGKYLWETRQNDDDGYIARGILEEAINKDKNILQAKIQLGQTYTGTADYDRASKIFYECLDYANQSNDKNIALLAMFNIGNIYLHHYQYDKAIENYEKALKIARKRNDKYNEGKLLNNIGSIYYYENNYKKAKEYYSKSKLINELIDDKQGIAEALYNLTSVDLEERNYNSALVSYKEIYDIFDSIDFKSQKGYALLGIAYSYMGMGKIEAALNFAESSLKSAREISDKKNELNSLTYLGEIYYCIGKNEEAMEIFLQSKELANDINDVFNSGISNQYLGLLMLRNDNFKNAMKYFDYADVAWKKMKDLTYGVWTNSAYALAAQRAGELSIAVREVLRTESILTETQPYKDYAMSVYYNLYNYYIGIGDTTLAKKYLSNANDEIIKRMQYIDNSKNKDELLNKVIEYHEIYKTHAKYFTNKQKE